MPTPFTRISVAQNGTLGNNDSTNPVFSADGSKIAFFSYASNLVAGDTNAHLDLFVKDLATGAVTLVSSDANGVEGNGDPYKDGRSPVFSPDGNLIAYASSATNLSPSDTDHTIVDVFVKNLTTGAVSFVDTHLSNVIDPNTGVPPTDGNSINPAFSADGHSIIFESASGLLVQNDDNSKTDVFISNLSTGAVTLVSVDTTMATSPVGGSLPVFRPDGSFVFNHYGADLAPVSQSTQFPVQQLYLRSAAGAYSFVSDSAAGVAGDGNSTNAVVSPDGTKVLFESYADNLVPGDTNNTDDIFIKDLVTGTVTLVSRAADGTLGNHNSESASFSPDGTKVVFWSAATNLVANTPTTTSSGIFVKDLVTGAVKLLTGVTDGTIQSVGHNPVFSPDGTKVALVAALSDPFPANSRSYTDVLLVNVACYCRSTRILTDMGERPIEDLAVGDMVVTVSGGQHPIKWIGRRSYADRFARQNPDLLPICFRAGSLGPAVPTRDLFVSPKHAMFIDGNLFPAWCLVNSTTIVRQREVRSLEYFHIELEQHDVILAEGAPAETFLDDDNRGMFHNHDEFASLYPDAPRSGHYYAPRIENGEALEAVHRRLAARAGTPAPVAA